jgi:NDP-sugar pyrophosphorylase family protein
VKAVVLVGGEGTRLRPLTLTTPKPLLPIGGVAFLERQLTWLARHGVTDVVLSLGYLPDAFVDHFPSGTFAPPDGPKVSLQYAVEPYPLGTAGAIRFAAEAGGIDGRFVVCNGDVLTTLDLTSIAAFHAERGGEATIHLTRVDDPSAFGVVPTYHDGEVKAFVEKPPAGAAPTDWINAGTYVLEPSVLERIPSELTVSIERETFPRMLEERGRLFAVATDDYWIDIGTPEKYLEAHADVLGGRLGLPPAPGAGEVQPGVWAHGEVSIAPDATVEGPVLLGSGTSIARGARVVGATVGPGCSIGEGAEVDRSVLCGSVSLGAGARVLGSIVGPDAVLEDGAVVRDTSVLGANVRLAAGTTVAGGRVPIAG